MSDNGYVDSSFNVIIKDVISKLHKKTKNILQLQDTATVGDAVELMDKYNISQIPVFENKTIKGVVSEELLLKPLFQGKIKLEDSISLAYHDKYHLIHENELLSNVTQALLKKEIVFIKNDSEITNILTDIDILHFISTKGEY